MFLHFEQLFDVLPYFYENYSAIYKMSPHAANSLSRLKKPLNTVRA